MTSPETRLAVEVVSYASYEALIESIRGFANPRVIEAMKKVPRNKFIDSEYQHLAFADEVVPIPGFIGKSTVSQPRVVALMTDMLDPQLTDTVLEIGTASGWQAAILGHLSQRVISVEYLHALTDIAKQRLNQLNIKNVHVLTGDGSRLFTLPGTFDKILVTASVPPLREQDLFEALKVGGKIVAPIGGVIGSPNYCILMALRKEKEGLVEEKRLEYFGFVPMEGLFGWTNFSLYTIASQNEAFLKSLIPPGQ